MKSTCKFILQHYLKYLAKLVLVICRPLVVVVAGSTNKYFFKEKIAEVLAEERMMVYSNLKGFNTEIGLPLAILGLPSGYDSYLKWLPIICQAPIRVFKKLPEILVLELGISDPGEMKKLLAIVKPRIAVITEITQRYLEAFDDVDELVGEYEYLAKKINKNGLLVLNYNNPRVRDLAKKAKAKIKFFSLGNALPPDIKKEDVWLGEGSALRDVCQQIKVNHNGELSSYQICRFGRHHIQALLAGLIVKEEILK